MEQILLIITILLMIIGAIISVLPVVPGTPLIFLAILGYGWTEGFHLIKPYFLLIMLFITVLSFFVDNLAGLLGARKFGASKAGVWGGIIGGLIGVFFNPLIGLLLGPFVGAIIAEILIGKSKFYMAFKIGIGTIIGYLSGGFLRMLLGLLMIVAFLTRVW